MATRESSIERSKWTRISFSGTALSLLSLKGVEFTRPVVDLPEGELIVTRFGDERITVKWQVESQDGVNLVLVLHDGELLTPAEHDNVCDAALELVGATTYGPRLRFMVRYYDARESRKGRGSCLQRFASEGAAAEFAKGKSLHAKPAKVEQIVAGGGVL